MNKPNYVSTAVLVAHDILDMHNEIQYLKRENERLAKYEKMYAELLDASIKHDGKMMSNLMGNLMEVLSVPGVLKAFKDNAELRENGRAESAERQDQGSATSSTT